jgi:hypothetical protein
MIVIPVRQECLIEDEFLFAQWALVEILDRRHTKKVIGRDLRRNA